MGSDPIKLIGKGVDVASLIHQLEAHPELWDANGFRRGGPQAQVSDIIVRYNDWSNWTGDRQKFNEEHESVWWDAYKYLPELKTIVFDIMRFVEGERLGMVLITRIPPHGQCLPHVDGGWHATYYQKYAVQIKSNEKQAFCFEKCRLVTNPGDIFTFDNSKLHWVENNSDDERVTLIISIKRDRPRS